MISLEQLNAEIAVLENETPSFSVMQKLSDLYTVRDHMGVECTGLPDTGSGSEFAETATGCDVKYFMAVMDELMQTLGLINRRLYDCVMQKLSDRG